MTKMFPKPNISLARCLAYTILSLTHDILHNQERSLQGTCSTIENGFNKGGGEQRRDIRSIGTLNYQ